MTTDLETTLTAWMESVPVSPEALATLREVDLPARRRMAVRPRLFGAGVAAGVVLLIGIVAVSLSPIVRRPAALPSASPSTSATRQCQVDDLVATSESVGSALGNGGAIVRLENVSGLACVVAGYPAIQLVSASGAPMTTVVTQAIEGDYLFPAMPITQVLLGAADVAAFQIGYPENPSGADTSLPLDVACPPASRLNIVLAGLSDLLAVALEIAPCEGHVNVSPIHAGPDWVEFSEATPEPTDGAQVNLVSMAWFDRRHGLFVGGSGPSGGMGTVWRTADGGHSWQSATLPGGALSVVTVSGAMAWAGSTCSLPAPCKNRLFRSDDGGVSWNRIAYQPVAALAFADKNHGWAIPMPEVNQSEPSILESTDGGATWVPRRSPCPQATGVPVAVSFPAPSRGWLACNGTVGAGNATKAILRTTDGEHWQVAAAAPWPDQGVVVGQISSSGYLSGLSMAASGTGMNWAGRGVSERTVDGGTTWAGMTATSFDVVIPASGWVINESDWLLYVWNGDAGRFILEESTDGGGSWGEASDFIGPG